MPSPISLWAESKIGPVSVEETHYAKPSPDGRYLYVFNMDSRNILVVDLEDRTIVQEIRMPGFWAQATEMIFSSDGRWMYTLSAGEAPVGDRHVVVVDTRTQQIDRLIRLPEDYEPGRTNITISPDERLLYICGAPGIYRVNIENEEVVKVSDIGGIGFLAFTHQGEHLLGADMATDSLDVIDPGSGSLIYSIPVGGSPQYILGSPDGQRVYVSNWESGDVSVVDLDAREVIATVPVGVNPLGMTTTPDGYKLYVAVTAQALEAVEGELPFKVVVVDTRTQTVVKEIRPGQLAGTGAPRFVNISPDGARVYVNEYIGRIHVIDTASDQLVDSILLTHPTTYLPDDIAITPDGSKLFVYARNIHQVLVMDTTAHTLLARFDAFSNAIAISSDGQRAYVPGFQFAVFDIPSLTVNYVDMPDIGGGEFKIVLSNDERIAYIADAPRDLLQVVDLENWRLIASIPVGNMGPSEFGLAITPDGNKVFVSNGYSKDISVVSTAENRVIGTIPMASTPVGIDVSPDGRVAYVIEVQSELRGFTHVVAIDTTSHRVVQRWDHEPIGFGNACEVVISPDGQRAYFGGIDGAIVVVLDVEDGATCYVDVGPGPFNLTLGEDGRLLYVSNKISDDITVIDTQTETVVDRIPIQVEGMGIVYATVTDSQGNPVVGDIAVQFVPYDQGVQGDFISTGFAIAHPMLDGYWIPAPEADYMLFVNTDRTDSHVVNQMYDGISDYERRAEATRVRVREGQITSVSFVLQEGHQVSGALVDQDGAPVSTGGNIADAGRGVNIGGSIGFGSGQDGHFSVVVPDGVYDLYFDGVLVAGRVSVYGDIDLGRITLGNH